MAPSDSNRKPQVGWTKRLTSILLSLSAGMAVNSISDLVGFTGLAGVIAVGAVLMAATWLRGLPAKAPLQQHAARVVLWTALGAATVGAIDQDAWAIVPSLTAALLTLLAVLLRTDAATAVGFVLVVALAGLGVALVGLGARTLLDHRPANGIVLVLLGITLFALTFTASVGRDTRAIGFTALGAAGLTIGIASFVQRAVTDGIAIIIVSGPFVGYGLGLLIRQIRSSLDGPAPQQIPSIDENPMAKHEAVRRIGFVGLGATFLAFGAALVAQPGGSKGWPFVLSAALIGVALATAMRAKRALLRGLAVACSGVCLAIFGILSIEHEFASRQTIAPVVLGIGTIGLGLALAADRAGPVGFALVALGVGIGALGTLTTLNDLIFLGFAIIALGAGVVGLGLVAASTDILRIREWMRSLTKVRGSADDPIARVEGSRPPSFDDQAT